MAVLGPPPGLLEVAPAPAAGRRRQRSRSRWRRCRPSRASVVSQDPADSRRSRLLLMTPATPSVPIHTEASYSCCGVRIDALQVAEAVEWVLAGRHGTGRSVHLCNAFTLSLAEQDPAFLRELSRGDLNLPDGTPVAWVGRRRGLAHMTSRVYGPDLLESTLAEGVASQTRHFLYGSTTDVLEQLRRVIEERYGAQVVGVSSPPFGDLGDEHVFALRDAVRESRADVVWVGLGTPKQDWFVERAKSDVPATLVAVGAAFDFLTGNKRQAPRWVQQRGLEWLFRLVTEPRRLWRRYLVGNAVFLRGLVREQRGRR